MFAVVYQFKIKEGKTEQFESSWRRMTELIKEYKGGLGSRLHKTNELNYIAYAQWPNKEMWSAKVKMSEEADKVYLLMKDACLESKTIHEMEMVDDLLEQV